MLIPPASFLLVFVSFFLLLVSALGGGLVLIAANQFFYSVVLVLFCMLISGITRDSRAGPFRRKAISAAGMTLVFVWAWARWIVPFSRIEGSLPITGWFPGRLVIPEDVSFGHGLSQYLRHAVLPNLQMALLLLGIAVLYAVRLARKGDCDIKDSLDATAEADGMEHGV
jgi:hypothetical protein